MEPKKNPNINVNDSSFTRLFFQIGLAIALAATFFLFWFTVKAEVKEAQEITYDFEETEMVEQTNQEEPPPPKEEVEQQVDVVDDTEEIKDTTQFKSNEFKPEQKVKEKPKFVKPKEKKAPKVFTIVEEPATFPGGHAAMAKFVQSIMEYPQEAKFNDVDGKVWIEMTVNQVGKVINVRPKMPKSRQLGYGLEEEAMRVIMKMPNWKPAKQASENVIQKFTIPIDFQLN